MDPATGVEPVCPCCVPRAPQNGLWGSDRQLAAGAPKGVGRVSSGRKTAAGGGHLQSRSHTPTMERTSLRHMQLALLPLGCAHVSGLVGRGEQGEGIRIPQLYGAGHLYHPQGIVIVIAGSCWAVSSDKRKDITKDGLHDGESRHHDPEPGPRALLGTFRQASGPAS